MNTQLQNFEQKEQTVEPQEIKSGGWLNEFLWICAGVNRKVLRQCPVDYAKYAGIGGTILFTALMAMLSGGYALYTVFEDPNHPYRSLILAAIFGIFWGLLIFNLDRFIVNTMYSDGKVTISMKELMAGLPRIIMAVFLGIVISTPLELKIFEDEIGVVIAEQKQERLNAYQQADYDKKNQIISRKDSLQNVKNEVSQRPFNIPVQGITNNNAINDLQAKRQEQCNEWGTRDWQVKDCQRRRVQLLAQNDDAAAEVLQQEINRHIQERAAARRKIDNIDAQLIALSSANEDLMKTAQEERKKELDDIQSEIDYLNANISEIDSKIRKDGYEDILAKEYHGFQARMSAFSEMKEKDASTNLSSIFIMLLFIIIETAPTFFKMMMASGPYDDLLRAHMHETRVKADKWISDINDNANTEITISTEKNKARLEAEMAANKEVFEKVAATQAELLGKALSAWREKELQKIEENPEQYIKANG